MNCVPNLRHSAIHASRACPQSISSGASRFWVIDQPRDSAGSSSFTDQRGFGDDGMSLMGREGLPPGETY
jgi:hypothetical protein